ncbi:hypothetical protein LTR50_003342 [Elasticomyces elasticus]|nr:hypothetical protein LTR50_003342 [Elasticomyces elasticus]
MKITSVGLAVLVSAGLVSALPHLAARDDDPCFCLDYDNDDNGKKFGGSYDLCSGAFEEYYPKPVYSSTDSCYHMSEFSYAGSKTSQRIQLLQREVQRLLQEAEVQEE